MAFTIKKLLKRRIKLEPENKQDIYKVGREQFKKLIERGTDLPVVLL